MAPFLKTLLSADYRRALAAEAAGDYQEAARGYALAGENAKVGEMHLLLAERAATPEARLSEVRTAVRWAEGEGAAALAVRRRVGRALLDHVRASGCVSERERGMLREAAVLLEGASDHAGAGECHELLGNETQAADAYQEAGEVDRLERVLSRDQARQETASAVRAAFDEYELYDAIGERALAAERVATCARLDPAGPYRALSERLAARRVLSGVIELSLDGGPAVSYCGAAPMVIGREVGCHLVLRDACVSRQHVEIVAGDPFTVRDLGSRNGTRLGGLRVAGTLPLRGEGDIDLGDDCRVAFRADGARLALSVTRGIERGRKLMLIGGPAVIAEGARLRFERGRPIIDAIGGARLRLNRTWVRGGIEPCRGDVIEVAAGEDEAGAATHRIEVPA